VSKAYEAELHASLDATLREADAYFMKEGRLLRLAARPERPTYLDLCRAVRAAEG
jgi:hypothetical protein